MLKRKYDTKEEIPAESQHLFTEQGGKWVLTGIEGIADADKFAGSQTALAAERTAHNETKKKLAAFGEHTPEQVTAAIEERDTLKLQAETAGVKPDENKIAQVVKDRVAVLTAALDRKITQLTNEKEAVTQRAIAAETGRKQDQIRLKMQEAAVEAGILKEAVSHVVALKAPLFDMDADGNLLTKEGPGVIPGMDPATVMSELRQTAPYFWAASQGGGATGGSVGGHTGPNPWAEGSWNMTEQGRISAKNPQQAKNLAAAAGVAVDAIAPKKKT